MFEEASRLKVRFETVKGNISTEDLWDLPLTDSDGMSLDDLAKALNKKVKCSEEESFVVKQSKANTILELKFSLVKHIIKEKLAEIEEKENAVIVKAKKERIDSLILEKEDDTLKGKSIADLKKMRNRL